VSKAIYSSNVLNQQRSKSLTGGACSENRVNERDIVVWIQTIILTGGAVNNAPQETRD